MDTYVVDLREKRPPQLDAEKVDGLYDELPEDYPDPSTMTSARRQRA